MIFKLENQPVWDFAFAVIEEHLNNKELNKAESSAVSFVIYIM